MSGQVASWLAWLRQHAAPAAHLCLDSRLVQPGDVFVACRGRSTDGRDYAAQAVQRGACAVLAEAGAALPELNVPVLQADQLPAGLGELGHLWYGKPSEALAVVAITGTNGKTSTVQWIAAALNADGVPCGTLGTLGVMLPDGSNLGGTLTTPDVLTVHRSLARIRDAGASVVALEASSIGLEQGRLDGVRIAVAGFTNLTHDHLDYHGSLQAYKQAKLALFARPELRRMVVNLDDPTGSELARAHAGPALLSYSQDSATAAALQATDVHTGTYGLVFNLAVPGGAAQIVTRLVGRHNISNLLLVAGVLHELGWSVARIARVLPALPAVPGRLQIVEGLADRTVAQPLVVVDYAHTPDALQRALEALRETAAARGGRLVCVFGCGGDRDKAKRPMMGRIAGDLADRVIVTSDNPRSEDPDRIIQDILAGMPDRTPAVQADRARAILDAIWQAQPADVVLLAGKGHETYQETQGERSVFDDREWARLALGWLGQPGLSIDTRSLRPGQLFLALKGEQFDGHDYLEQARAAGACAAVVARRVPAVDLLQIEVGSTDTALARMGAAWRARFDLPAIAVTGSNGKTTTKEMTAAVLRAWQGEQAALWTVGNLNNHIGLPLTLLRLSQEHRAAVFELGMNHPGEIAMLADLARPTVALVNNAQREHQEFMHSVEAVAQENGAVIAALEASGTAVFPGDDTYTPLWAAMAGGRRVLRFGLDSSFEVHADAIQAQPHQTSFQLHIAGQQAAVVLRAPGLHNLRNALAAAACASAAGAPLQAIRAGLEAFSPVAGRMHPMMLPDGHQLIDDTYNANPDSVRAAIDVLARLQGRRTLVLGDMAEVGEQGPAMHAEVGAYACERGIEMLLTFGPAARHSAAAFGDAAHAFEDMEALVACLLALPAGHILVKGSRSTRMERVVRACQQHFQINNNEGGHHAA